MKKLRFGAGKWNGFGGRIEAGETPREAAGRELLEEAVLSVDPSSLQDMGEISFYFGENPTFHCHIFVAKEWVGEPEESDEMRPEWFPIQELPLTDMWESDVLWLPRVLAGERVSAVCHFDDSGTRVESFTEV